MQYPLFFFALLAFLAGNSGPKEQAVNKPLTDSITCKQSLTQDARYNYGYDSTLTPLKDQRKEFVIIVDKNCKATNFISHIETSIRKYPSDTGTVKLFYPSTWASLPVSEKMNLLAKNRIDELKRANAEHEKNNNGTNVIRILNNTTDTVYLQAQDGTIMAVMQALNKNGEWRSIQYWQFSKCANSYHNLGFLPNKEAAVTAQLPNRGNYETKLRLKVMGRDRFYYSNEFTGKIDYCEFATPNPPYNCYLDTLIPARTGRGWNWLYPM